MKWSALLDSKLHWRLQRETPAPLGVAVLCRRPAAFQVVIGRILLGWTEWCLVSEVVELMEQLTAAQAADSR